MVVSSTTTLPSTGRPRCTLIVLISNIIITARVAKRAKVMFSHACVTHSVQLEEWGMVRCQPPPPLRTGQRSSTSPSPRTCQRSTTSPSPQTGQRSTTYPPPPPAVRILLGCNLVNLPFNKEKRATCKSNELLDVFYVYLRSISEVRYKKNAFQ